MGDRYVSKQELTKLAAQLFAESADKQAGALTPKTRLESWDSTAVTNVFLKVADRYDIKVPRDTVRPPERYTLEDMVTALDQLQRGTYR